jgi:hypothetical protein
MLIVVAIGPAKLRHETRCTLILWPLRQVHAKQFAIDWRFALLRVVGESEIACKAGVKIPHGNLVESPVIRSLHF